MLKTVIYVFACMVNYGASHGLTVSPTIRPTVEPQVQLLVHRWTNLPAVYTGLQW